MKILKWIGCLLLALVTLAACSSDSDDNGGAQQNAEVITLNVDVILPQDIYAQWKNTIGKRFPQ